MEGLVEAQKQFSRDRKAQALFHHLCFRGLNIIAKAVKNRLGFRGFGHPIIKLLREDPSWEKDFLSTSVMRGPGKRAKTLSKILKIGLEFYTPDAIRFGFDRATYEEREREIIARGFEKHKSFEDKVRSSMQQAKLPIGKILSDKNTIINFLETGILPSTGTPI